MARVPFNDKSLVREHATAMRDFNRRCQETSELNKTPPDYGSMTSEELTALFGPRRIMCQARTIQGTSRRDGPLRMGKGLETRPQRLGQPQMTGSISCSSKSRLTLSRRICIWLLAVRDHIALRVKRLAGKRASLPVTRCGQEPSVVEGEAYERTGEFQQNTPQRSLKHVPSPASCRSQRSHSAPPFQGDCQ